MTEKSYYIYSTLASDNIYSAHETGGGDMPVPIPGVLIRGGTGVMRAGQGALVTPRGVATRVTETELNRLMADATFILHEKNGYLQIEESEAPAEAVAANMRQDDPSRQLEPGDFVGASVSADGSVVTLGGEDPKADTGPSKINHGKKK